MGLEQVDENAHTVQHEYANGKVLLTYKPRRLLVNWKRLVSAFTLDSKYMSPLAIPQRSDHGMTDNVWIQQVTSNSDQVVNESIGKGKSLRMAMGFASPHLPLLLPGRLMGDFNTIILPFALPMHEAWRDLFKAQKHFAGND